MSAARDDDTGHADALLAVLDAVVGRARPGEAVEVVGMDRTETTVRAYGGEVEALTSARTRGVGVRVVDGHRVGYAHTADLSESSLAETLADARTNATVATVDEGNVLPAGGALVDDLALYDHGVAATSIADKVDLALELEAATRGASARVKGVDSCAYGDTVSHAAIASTAGPRGAYRRSDAYVAVEALAEADGATTSAYGLDLARAPGDLNVAGAAAEAAGRAERLLGGRKPASATLPVLLDPFAAASLLGVLAGALSAEAVQKGRSLFAERLGERLAGEHVALIDDGRRLDGPGAAPWDGEGVVTARTTLLDAGVLAGWLHNTYTATRAGTTSTGNASRPSHQALPRVAPTNLYLAPGADGPEALLARAGTGFYCQQLLGVHSGADAISGDISVGAAGVMVRDGAFAEPVREATIASTVGELLAGLVAVGSDLRFLPVGGGSGGSTLLIERMALSGS